MKNKIISLISGVALLAGLTACEQPHEFSPTHYSEHFTSVFAKFYDDDRDENYFPAEVDDVNHIINFVFPYNYPPTSENILTMNDLEKVRVECNMPSGLVLEPAFTQMNFNEPHQVVVVTPYGERVKYDVTCEIRKSAECSIEEFVVLGDDTAGIIKDTNNTVTLLTTGNIGTQYARYELSHGATISPDPAITPINYDAEPEFTVTAQDGVTKRVYKIIKGEPQKMPFGLRENSAKIVWTKKLADLGIAPSQGKDGATGLGVLGNYVVVNNGMKNKALLLNLKTGALEGELDLSACGVDNDGNGNNYRITSDDHDNLLIVNNSQTNGNQVTIWRKQGVDGAVKKLIQTASIGNQMGNQMSITGNVDGNGILTLSANGTAIDFYRWRIDEGTFDSKKPETVHAQGYAGTCWGTADISYVDPTNPNGRFIIAAYCGFSTLPPSASGSNNRTVAMFEGSGALASYGTQMISSNWVENAGDVQEFNGVSYYIHNSVNTFTWGSDDCLYMYDLGSGNLATPILDFSDNGLNFNRQYGATAAGSQGRGGNANDVMFYVSPDGFYMYILFQFTNGSVGCIRTDCIDMSI